MSADMEIGPFTVTVFVGGDGTPVVQIDGGGELRVNINDGAVFDQSTEDPGELDYSVLNTPWN